MSRDVGRSEVPRLTEEFGLVVQPSIQPAEEVCGVRNYFDSIHRNVHRSSFAFRVRLKQKRVLRVKGLTWL